MSDATEHLAAHSGPAVAGLINVSLGNAPELIIATFAVAAGLHELVKATLVGSIIANELAVLGGAMLVGGRKRARQTFSSTAVQSRTGLVLVVVAAPALPAVAQLVKEASCRASTRRASCSTPRWALWGGRGRDPRGDLRPAGLVFSAAPPTPTCWRRTPGRSRPAGRGRSAGR